MQLCTIEFKRVHNFVSAIAKTIKKPLFWQEKNKLPRFSYRKSYGLEYGTDKLYIQESAISPYYLLVLKSIFYLTLLEGQQIISIDL